MQEVFRDFDIYLKENVIEDNIYLDFSKTKKSLITFNNEYFYDANHCNKSGAEALAPIISSIISELEQNTYNSENYFYSTFEEMVEDCFIQE